MSTKEQVITHGILDSVEAHSKSLETFEDDHTSPASSIKHREENIPTRMHGMFMHKPLKLEHNLTLIFVHCQN